MWTLGSPNTFQSSVCKSNGFMGKDKVGGDGSASDGWWVVGGGLKTFDTAAYDEDPWAQSARAQLDAAGIDWKTNPTHFSGNAMFGWALEQTLRIASDLDGGLTRVNFMIAQRNMDMTAPFLLEGARFDMSGTKDVDLVEAATSSSCRAKSSNCAWSHSAAACA